VAHREALSNPQENFTAFIHMLLNADEEGGPYFEPNKLRVDLTFGGRANINSARLSAGIAILMGSIAAPAHSK
jgi:hypothetical protein